MTEQELLQPRPGFDNSIENQNSQIDTLLSSVSIDVSIPDYQPLLAGLKKSIEKNPKILSELTQDIEVAKKNPAEKSRIEQLYLKGYGSLLVLKEGESGSSMSYMELYKNETPSELAKYTRGSKANYILWKQLIDIGNATSRGISQEQGEKKVLIGLEKGKVNETIEKIKITEHQDTIRSNETCKELNTRLTGMISDNGNQIIEKGIKDIKDELEKNPKETESKNPIIQKLTESGITQEMIGTGKYDDTIRSHFILQNEINLRKEIKPGQEKEFDKSLTTLRTNLGYPLPATIENAKSLTSNIVLWENRERVTNKLESIVSTGEYKTMSWNRDTRQIRLEAKDGTTRVIETAIIPPRERIVKNGLSIDQIIPNESKEFTEYKKSVRKIREEQSKNEEEIGKNSDKVSQIVLDTENPIIKYPEKYSTKKLLDDRNKEYEKLKTPEGKTEEKVSAINELIRISLDLKGKNLNQIMNEGDNVDVSKLNSQLESEGEGLSNLKKLLSRRIELEKESGLNERKKPKEIGDNFESVAKSNLSFLIDLGYDKIGQGTLDKVLASLNAEYQGVMQGQDYIDLGREELDNQQRQRILLGLTRLMQIHGQGLMPEWDKVNPDDQYIAYRQTRSPLWNVSLQKLGKIPGFQSLIIDSDISKIRNQVIGREKPTETK